MKKQIKINALLQAKLIKLLMEGTYSCAELADMTGLHYVTVLQYTRELHEAGAARICMWVKDERGRDLIKVYKLGEGNDKKRHRMTDAQRQARYREKMKQKRMQKVMAGKAEFVSGPRGGVLYREFE